jgi:hypothetical protein
MDMTNSKRISTRQRRQRADARNSFLGLLATAAAFAALIGGGYAIDRAHDVPVYQSLASNGL